MQETIRSSEMSVNTISTRRHIPEDCFLHSHRRENFKSYIIVAQLIKIFPPICGTSKHLPYSQESVTHPALSQMNLVHFSPSYFSGMHFNMILPTSCFPNDSLFQVSRPKFVGISLLPPPCYTLRSSQPP
jgi:hypothetical protein